MLTTTASSRKRRTISRTASTTNNLLSGYRPFISAVPSSESTSNSLVPGGQSGSTAHACTSLTTTTRRGLRARGCACADARSVGSTSSPSSTVLSTFTVSVRSYPSAVAKTVVAIAAFATTASSLGSCAARAAKACTEAKEERSSGQTSQMPGRPVEVSMEVRAASPAERGMEVVVVMDRV
ncbi:predicted protein [Aspergillus terreus NIH2624]|uniref:Uncharacterized protein n=1 Tax=Aspergillus terreus (strain NIH 2624 / FGSC A1156) TaxID=341663 RepID=Q0CN18_ASPTN|nr:uncharacterized protein ATEG_04916 [Aspergillus terreus NIH2624]EAU35363.1 predicted protein [Aspergillus terreus NIH2624]